MVLSLQWLVVVDVVDVMNILQENFIGIILFFEQAACQKDSSASRTPRNEKDDSKG